MKKKHALIIGLFVIVYLSVILISVDFNLFEFKLSIKTVLRQGLTLEEMRQSNLYEAYKQIDRDTKIETIDSLLQKKSRNILEHFETWDFPYGYVSVWVTKNNDWSILNKVARFDTPYTRKIDEKELRSVYECSTLEELSAILGEPMEIGKTYTKNPEVSSSYYTWGIKTNYTQKFLEDMKNSRKPINLPLNGEKRIGKFRISVEFDAANEMIRFSLEDYDNPR